MNHDKHRPYDEIDHADETAYENKFVWWIVGILLVLGYAGFHHG